MRIWHAGCSTGEEVYSMAILLQEEGLYERCRIYATDINEHRAESKRGGHLPASPRCRSTPSNYLQGGGTGAFSDYYTARYDTRSSAVAARERRLRAAQPGDRRSFNHFNVIFCRNVLIYFNNVLQERVQPLPRQPGDVRHPRPRQEGVDPLHHAPDNYDEIDADERLYKSAMRLDSEVEPEALRLMMGTECRHMATKLNTTRCEPSNSRPATGTDRSGRRGREVSELIVIGCLLGG